MVEEQIMFSGNKPTQVSASTFCALRNPLSFIPSVEWEIDGHLGEAGFFAQRPEERTEAARPKELVVFAIGAQFVWRDTFRALYRPKTMKNGILQKVNESWRTSARSSAPAFGD